MVVKLKVIGKLGKDFLVEKLSKSEAKRIPQLITAKFKITKISKNDVEGETVNMPGILRKIKRKKDVKDFKIIYYEKIPNTFKVGSILEAVGYFVYKGN